MGFNKLAYLNLDLMGLEQFLLSLLINIIISIAFLSRDLIMHSKVTFTWSIFGESKRK